MQELYEKEKKMRQWKKRHEARQGKKKGEHPCVTDVRAFSNISCGHF